METALTHESQMEANKLVLLKIKVVAALLFFLHNGGEFEVQVTICWRKEGANEVVEEFPSYLWSLEPTDYIRDKEMRKQKSMDMNCVMDHSMGK